jgi:hypothetical protein
LFALTIAFVPGRDAKEIASLSTSRRIARWIGRGLARIAYSHFVEPVWLETRRVDVPVVGLDERADGLSILHLTDFHLCRRVPITLIRQAVETGRRAECDLIALTGDFVHAGFHFVEPIARILSRLRAPLGAYAVLGNHDYSVRNIRGTRRKPQLAPAVAKALSQAGISVLHNESRILDVCGARIAVAGVADYWSGESDLEQALTDIDPATPRIVLAHNPCSLEQAPGERCDLMLSGHTHGGQVAVPGLGRPMLSRRMKRYAEGLLQHPQGYLYVNKGIGYTVRFRFQTRPEIAILRLRRANAKATGSP